MDKGQYCVHLNVEENYGRVYYEGEIVYEGSPELALAFIVGHKGPTPEELEAKDKERLLETYWRLAENFRTHCGPALDKIVQPWIENAHKQGEDPKAIAKVVFDCMSAIFICAVMAEARGSLQTKDEIYLERGADFCEHLAKVGEDLDDLMDAMAMQRFMEANNYVMD